MAESLEKVRHERDAAVDALRKFYAFYMDLAESNPGFMGKLCLQDYAGWNEALIASAVVLKDAEARDG